MIKLIENMFFTQTITQNAFLEGTDTNPADMNKRNENGKFEAINADDYEEVKTSIDENDWSLLNFMHWFAKEKPKEEMYLTGAPDKTKIGSDDKRRFKKSNLSIVASQTKPSG